MSAQPQVTPAAVSAAPPPSWRVRLLPLWLVLRHPLVALERALARRRTRKWQQELLALADGKDATYWATASLAFRKKAEAYRQSLGRSHPKTQEALLAAHRAAAIMMALKSQAPR